MKIHSLSFLLIIFCFLQSPLQAQDTMKIKGPVKLNTFGIICDVAFFPESTTGAAYLTSLEYSSKNKVPVVLRVNIAQRFGTTGMQMEGDAYPVLNKKTYAYINAGVAVDILFPQYRSGLSLFRALPGAFEAEGGFRFLYFKSPVWIYTASLGKYYKRLWFNVSTFLTPDNGYVLQSYFLKTRYYLSERSYVMITIGTGISPDDRRNNNQLTALKMLQSKRADLGFKLFLKRDHVLTFGAGFMKQKDQDEIAREQLSTIIGYHKIF